MNPKARNLEMTRFPVVIIGAGVVGYLCALGLAQAGIEVALVGVPDLRKNARTVALLGGSIELLQQTGVWQTVEANTAALKVMRIFDATGSLFTLPPVEFSCQEIGYSVFGYNIANHQLLQKLSQIASNHDHIHCIPHYLEKLIWHDNEVAIQLENGDRLEAQLVIGADGRNSQVRNSTNIAVHTRRYRQIALTCLLSHSQPHENVSTEIHTRQGPCTLVPMPATSENPHSSSLVWMMTPSEGERRQCLSETEFTRELERQVFNLLGKMHLTSVRSLFHMQTMAAKQLVGGRLMLAGEAAHVFPPIGAQGLNLGLRDAKTIIQLVATAVRAKKDPGLPATVNAYAKSRLHDIESRHLGVDMLNRSLLQEFLPVDFLRGTGLLALQTLSPLRQLMIRLGMGHLE